MSQAAMLNFASNQSSVPPGNSNQPVVVPSKPPRAERIALWSLVVTYLVVVIGYAIATPYGEAPDESSHLRYIEYLERFHQLPNFTPPIYTVEAFQPPLYYSVGAAIVIASRKLTGYPSREALLLPEARQRHIADLGRNGHLNFFFHAAAERWSFWTYPLRAVSILMGLGVVLLTYYTARTLLPQPLPATIPLIATAFAALIPQANSIRASIANGNLGDLISAWIIFLLVQHIMLPISLRRVVWIGVALGLGLISKLTVGLLIVPLLCVLWIRRDKRPANLLRNLAIIAASVLVLAGWLYIYRLLTYGDPIAAGAMRNVLPPDKIYPDMTTLFWLQEPFRMVLWRSFWGTFGFQLIWMPIWIYDAFTLLTVAGIAGGLYLLVRRALNRGQWVSCAVMVTTILLMYLFVIYYSTYLVAWQGRLLFPALSSICVLLAFGLGGLVVGPSITVPVAMTKWQRLRATFLLVGVTLAMLSLNVYCLFWLIIPGLN